ncbi:uncharacterized protein LOC107982140 [Nasonia vitripennis]|uniref:Uncharacterized protein n=1 Tax=Nasonia vitripennis TaxID=7425 RepID=A0A7M7M804_NASVI|nr:uncharacterized protein LOC107982140 [Nasonia vitripennis]
MKPKVDQPKASTEEARFPSKGYRLGTKAEEDAKILQAARALENVMVSSTSRVDRDQKSRSYPKFQDSLANVANSIDDEEDDDLRKALQLSLEYVTAPPTPDQEDVRWHRLNYLNRMNSRGSTSEGSTKLNT